MKMKIFLKYVFTISLAVTIIGCSSSNDNPTESAPPNPFSYPTSADINEQGNGNDTFATATSFSIGGTQLNSIYPQGDTDVYAIELTANTNYEFSANKLCATCDTYMSFFDTDGITQISANDDYLGYDSNIQYTPTVSGIYYVEIKAYNSTFGISNYTFGARLLIDDDNDGWSNYHDCNDNDANILPDESAEIAGDNIDQSCTGSDLPLATTPDMHEIDDTPATSVIMKEAEGSPSELIYRSELFSATGNLRTIDSAGAVDYMKISVPARSALEMDNVLFISNGLAVTVFEGDGTTIVSEPNSEYNLYNTTENAMTFYLKYEASNGTDTGVYIPFYVSLGIDMDGDGFYTKDWDSSRDCNDSDAVINPGVTEIVSDGIDSNCNGNDDT